MKYGIEEAKKYIANLSQKEIDERFSNACKEIEKIDFTNNSNFETFLNLEEKMCEYKEKVIMEMTFAA